MPISPTAGGLEPPTHKRKMTYLEEYDQQKKLEMTAKASSDDSIEDEIDALLESSLKTKDLNNSTWNFEDYKKYTIKKSAPVPEIMSLMTKAIEKE